MDDIRPKEHQQELFTEFAPASKKADRFPTLAKSNKPLLFSTNAEQLILAGILSILILCAVFFLGVLRGKSLRHGILATPPSTYVPSQPVNAAPAPVAVPRVAVPAVSTPAPGRASSSPIQPPKSFSAADKPYTIQLVTHRKKEFAENEMNAIRSRGYYSFLIPSGEYFQVCVGQYASKEDAKTDLGRFTTKYKDCFLRRR